MPSPYRDDIPRLKAEIVARVDAGAPLRAVCAPRGAPSVATVGNWARRDPLFAADLAAAKRRGAWRRLWLFDEAKAAAFLARARAGEAVELLWGQPGMPTRSQYRRWKTAQPPFAEAVFALLQRRDARFRDRGRTRRRDFDQGVADRVAGRLFGSPPGVGLKDMLKAHPELPCWEIVMRWRRERPAFDAVLKQVMANRRRRVRPVPPELIEDVTDHIVMGGTFLSYSRSPGGPAFGTLRRWMCDPDFARAVGRACDLREELLLDLLGDAAREVPPGPIREMNRAVAPLTRRIGWLKNRPRKPRWPKARGNRLSPAETGEREG